VFDPAADTELHTDVSGQGFGAILLQKQKSGDMVPVAYFSKTTTDAEKKYHSFKLETLAIVKALERFHVYLHGRTFRVITDCNSLALAIKKININPRIARWSLAFQNYQFELVHRPGNKMAHVDCLSRNPTINAITAEDEVMYRQLSDPKLKEIAERVELLGSKNFAIIEGFRKHRERELFVVPESMVSSIIRIYHDDTGHVGVEKTVQGITDHYWFPNLKYKVKQYIKNCVKCLSYSIASGKPEGEMQIYEKGSVPFNTIHVDHFGPMEVTKGKFKYILVIVDAFTKFVWLFPTKSTGTDEVVKSLTVLFGWLGTPSRIVSDRGTAFTSQKFAEFVDGKNIKHVKTAVASPWANGQVERVNRFLKSTLAKITDDPTKWNEKISVAAQYAINNSYHKAIGSTPSQAFFGFGQRREEDKELRAMLNKLCEIDEEYVTRRTEVQRNAQEVNRKLQEYNKLYYDKRHKKVRQYNVGDLVLVRKLQNRPGINTKLIPKFKGPYQIKAILKKNRFVVTDVPGYNVTSKPYNTILSADKIKWIRIADPNKVQDSREEIESKIDSEPDETSGNE